MGKLTGTKWNSELPDNKLREDFKLELLDWLGDRYSGAEDMPYDEIVRLNDISLNVTLDNLEKITGQLLLEARLDTLNQIRHSDVKLNHGTIELMGYMSQQLNKQKQALGATND